MGSVRAASPLLADLEPYDPKYLPAEAYLSANENPWDIEGDLRREVAREIAKVPFNRYPDPLANELRDLIAEANGLSRESVLIGNGGDELLYNVALAWGGPGRAFLNLPPTFSSYEANARLTGTAIVDIARRPDYSIDEEAVFARLGQGDIDFVVVASPNNPTGCLAPDEFLLRLLDATDALVLVDEAYFEFSRHTLRPYLDVHENLVLLRTFSKAFSLAGVRLGYLLGNPQVISEIAKVRQPYSVDAISQAVGRAIYRNRAQFERGIMAIIGQRELLLERLAAMDGVRVHPSDSNYILFSVPDAAGAWEHLYQRGILVRDFSKAPGLEGHLRVSVGTEGENLRFLEELGRFLDGRQAGGGAL